MAAIEEGRVCLKLAGRDAGSKCVVTKVLDANNVEIRSAGRKKVRKSNINHLEPTTQVIDAKDEAAVAKALA